MLRNRRLRKSLKQTKHIPIDSNTTGGFAYVIIPSDVERKHYINEVYSTFLCSVVTTYNQVLNNVSIPKELIDEIQFPQLPGQYGTLVRYVIDKNSQVSIVSTHIRPDETAVKTEGKYTYNKENNSISFNRSIDLVVGQYSVIMSSSPSVGANILLKSIVDEKQSTISVTDTQVDVDANDEINFNVEVQESSIKISDKILIGTTAQQPAVLGNELISVLQQLISACQQMTVVTMVAGAPVTSSPPTNQSTFASLLNDLQKLLSKKVLVQ